MADIRARWIQEWNRENPILRDGEPGYDRTSGRIKVGNGRSRWTELNFLTDTAGLSATQLAADSVLKSAFVARAPTAFLDASNFSDGAFSALGTGQAVTLFGNSPAVISGGKIVHNPTPGTNKAAYIQVDLGAPVIEIGATIEFPAANAGSAAFVLPLAPWSNGNFTNAGVHLVVQGDGAWHVSTWNGTAEAPIYYAGKLGALNDGTARKFVIELDRTASTLIVRFPDGSISPVISHANIAALTGNYAIWELFEPDTTTSTPARFHAIWAATTVARVDRTRPQYADLLRGDLAALLGAIPVSKEIIAEPAGTTSSNVLTSRVELGRVTIRRPPTGKINVELQAFLGWKQRNILAIAWFGAIAIGAPSVSGSYTKAWQIGGPTNFQTDNTTPNVTPMEQTFSAQVELSLAIPAINGGDDRFDIVCCVVRVNGNDGDLKYRINDAAGQRAFLKASPVS